MAQRQKVIVTHDGTFHSDDVFAVAALLIFLNGDALVARTRDEKQIASADFVVDVGDSYDEPRNRFDHHQKEGAGVRSNGIPYAAFGLVWKSFGEKISGGREAAEAIDCLLVQPLDAYDNGVSLFENPRAGVYSYTLSDVVRAFSSTWREREDTMDARFSEAVSFAKQMLLRLIEHERAQRDGEEKVASAYRSAPDKRIVELPGNYPWKNVLARFPEPLLVVHPQGEEWYVECVRDDPQSFVNRKNLPASWAGLRVQELARVTGVPDAVFCHRNGFMAVAQSRAGALKLAHIALVS